MRAAVVHRWGPPSVLEIDDIPVPEISANQVLVRVEACGVAYHDVVQRNGAMGRGPQPPIVLGYEIAGAVERVGAAVTTLQPGDRVCNKPWNSCGLCRFCRNGMETACSRRVAVHGGYAEYAALPEEVLVKIPENLSAEAACMLGGATGVALNAVRDVGQVRVGETVLVTGASGGLGLATIELARLSGARVIALTRSEKKRQPILDQGAHEVVVSGDGADFSATVRDLTGRRGVDLVIDNVGSRVFKPGFKSIATGGRYVFVGQLFREDIAINPAFIFFSRAKLLGVGSVRRDQLEDVVALAGQGALHPKVAEVFALQDIAKAHARVEAGEVIGRVVVKP